MSEPEIEGCLFDVYNFEDEIHVWIRLADGRMLRLRDAYQPVIYAAGPSQLLSRLCARLYELQALAREPRMVKRRHFYQNRMIPALEMVISRPSVMRKIKQKLYAFYRRMDIYHADIETPTSYMYAHDIYPLCPVRVVLDPARPERLLSIRPANESEEVDYRSPPLRTMHLQLEHSHRLPISLHNAIVAEYRGQTCTLSYTNMSDTVRALHEFLTKNDPDVILSAYGDPAILPALFQCAQQQQLELALDRDPIPNQRRILRQGSSYNTYGSWIYMAPSYPLFGRWHIDRANSFVYKESELHGVLELARLSRLPVQRLARSSTGAALTAIEMHVALKLNYLAPWQKSAAEDEKSALDLLTADKGALVYVPDTREAQVYENTAQLDFSQMYPSIMAIHNISPETVNCRCCRNDPQAPRVPEVGYVICRRRRGVVSISLERVLARRKFYKSKVKELKAKRDLLRGAGAASTVSAAQAQPSPADVELQRLQEELELYESRQSSLKWMLVTSFGYLGYRNAKFGRIESHESVTAFGREKLLTAKEIAEDRGYRLLHAITDCIFIDQQGAPLDEQKLQELCTEIGQACGIEMGMDGVYSWVVFAPSRVDPDLPVVNRYFGRFQNGELKFRGIFARRKDTPAFIREGQLRMLQCMSEADSIAALRAMAPQLRAIYRELDEQLRQRKVPWQTLLLRRTISQDLDSYTVNNGSRQTLAELRNLGVETQPGEKVRFLALSVGRGAGRYLSEERAQLMQDAEIRYDQRFYRKMLWESYREIFEYFAPAEEFQAPPDDQLRLFAAQLESTPDSR
ncbi:MAG: DNA polymerase [Leptospirales bacterium]|nr:DNA polymerase [Leptospirales bacterium]